MADQAPARAKANIKLTFSLLKNGLAARKINASYDREVKKGCQTYDSGKSIANLYLLPAAPPLLQNGGAKNNDHFLKWAFFLRSPYFLLLYRASNYGGIEEDNCPPVSFFK